MTLGVAVVGLGVGEQHARAYGEIEACRVRTVIDLDVARARRVAAEFPGCEASCEFADVLERTDIDIVSIASFDDMHFDQVMRSLAAGKHVFVEKPLCRTGQELARIRAALAAHPTQHLSSNLVLRGADLYRWLKSEIAEGHFGEIYAFDGDYLYGRLHKITSGWRSEMRDYSVMLGGGIHLIDLMLWLTGQRPDVVSAIGNRICTRDKGFGGADFAAATMAFPTGLVGRITANFGCVHRHQHVVRIFGTKKTFVLDDAGARIMTARDPVVPGTPVPPPEKLRLAEKPPHKGVLIPDFVDGIVRKKSPRNADLSASLDAVAVAIGCDEATRTSSPTKIVYQ